MADQTPNEDTISLEDLIRDTAAQTDAPPVGQAVDLIDKVLAVEDPGFAAELTELKSQGVATAADVAVDDDIESILASERAEKRTRGLRLIKLWLVTKPWRKFLRALSTVMTIGPWVQLTVWPATKRGSVATLSGLKASAKYSGGKAKAGFSWFAKLPMPSKALVILVIAFAVGSVVMVRVAWRGSFLPSLQRDFLVSFANVADHSYEIQKGEAWADLNDPLLHPEHIVLIERLIVNLRAPGDGSNPMALIDLYIEAGSQDAAVEVKDRDAAMRDMISRTMEQMTLDELSTDAGKNKLKVFLRKNLNDMMVRGRIRRVYYKSMVIKP